VLPEHRSANPFPLRLGLLGQSDDLPPGGFLTPEQKHARFFDHLHGHALHAFGFHHPHSELPRREATAVQEAAQACDVATHFVWDDAPPVEDTSLLHAAAAIHARLAETAARAGCLTYTLHPPLLAQNSLEEFRQVLGHFADRLRGLSVPPISLQIVTPPQPSYLLHDVLDLRDFARETGFLPTIHAGFLHAVEGRSRNLDQWRELLKECPGQLFLYANQAVESGRLIAARSFEGDATATPPITPLLKAILEQRGTASLLLRGGHNESEAVEILNILCQLTGQDARAILAGRQFQFPERKRSRLVPSKS
jgi:hypothetical protein